MEVWAHFKTDHWLVTTRLCDSLINLLTERFEMPVYYVPPLIGEA